MTGFESTAVAAARALVPPQVSSARNFPTNPANQQVNAAAIGNRRARIK